MPTIGSTAPPVMRSDSHTLSKRCRSNPSTIEAKTPWSLSPCVPSPNPILTFMAWSTLRLVARLDVLGLLERHLVLGVRDLGLDRLEHETLVVAEIHRVHDPAREPALTRFDD